MTVFCCWHSRRVIIFSLEVTIFWLDESQPNGVGPDELMGMEVHGKSVEWIGAVRRHAYAKDGQKWNSWILTGIKWSASLAKAKSIGK